MEIVRVDHAQDNYLQVRRILLNLAENANLFQGAVPAKLRKPWHLTTPDIAIMDEDTSLTLSTIGQRLQKALDLEASQCPYSARLQVRQMEPLMLGH